MQRHLRRAHCHPKQLTAQDCAEKTTNTSADLSHNAPTHPVLRGTMDAKDQKYSSPGFTPDAWATKEHYWATSSMGQTPPSAPEAGICGMLKRITSRSDEIIRQTLNQDGQRAQSCAEKNAHT
ncbi:hypothetical protein J3458_003715 [Metarhizium acridum]|uniref:uncharacterized protein n=1 Tax=Metarhizium acridum TaxID=92637 RepID=UPI001C6BE6C2|nr:hypothetical protein J3458_003715 [Metarhizium acridum]